MEELTPDQLNERAEELRDCARTAREIAGSLGAYVDSPVTAATAGDPAIWSGPYADETTGQLQGYQWTLRDMASALMSDASRWESEAQVMEDEAAGGGD